MTVGNSEQQTSERHFEKAVKAQAEADELHLLGDRHGARAMQAIAESHLDDAVAEEAR